MISTLQNYSRGCRMALYKTQIDFSISRKFQTSMFQPITWIYTKYGFIYGKHFFLHSDVLQTTPD